ncbi:MAG: hypothetical protein ACTHOB_12845 [Ginsengibacter sp.]
MTKKKILLFIPLIIITALLIYCWTTILFTDIIATWQHYMALGLFAVLVFLYFKSFNNTIIATGLYLLLATFNGLSMTPTINTSWFRIGTLETPPFQILSLGLLVLFLILNSDALVNLYLDYKEAKTQHKT